MNLLFKNWYHKNLLFRLIFNRHIMIAETRILITKLPLDTRRAVLILIPCGRWNQIRYSVNLRWYNWRWLQLIIVWLMYCRLFEIICGRPMYQIKKLCRISIFNFPKSSYSIQHLSQYWMQNFNKTKTTIRYYRYIIYLELLCIFMNSFNPYIMRISILGIPYIWYDDTDIHSCWLVYTQPCSQREKESKVKETNTKHVELYTCMKVVSFRLQAGGH